MSSEIKVPQLGESVVEATVGEWAIQVGDSVSIGDVIVSLETDKVDVEVGAEVAGVLVEIVKDEGEDVAVGETIGRIDANGASAVKEAAAPTPAAPEVATPAPTESAPVVSAETALGRAADALGRVSSASR